ncbi:MAG: hypothetical protein GOVbin1678_42 [Prokaryotic dsDNA virus sp.]|jgi:hypothetical protein|nr:MAG: hypothetical protein GOVbin1678_42 [Prokaryotic dsDNA virus sp.]|tara:strand:+ start:21496 stop:22488 length:993 start_codon:yes stop_codon:yes gene_type:complete
MELTNKMLREGVEYLTENNEERGYVGSYHHSGRIGIRDLNIASKVDVAGLTRVADRQNIVESPYNSLPVKSKFTIGFEIEKRRLHRGAVREYPLFAGFETDSSCGYEAVTNILPLVKPSIWRNKVFNMFHQAERIIEDRYSPSCTSCGGHISIGVEGMSGEDLMEKVRNFSGIVLALFRYRLKNSYCRHNASMRTADEQMRGALSISNRHHKYNLATAKRHCLEFRIPSRVTSVNQLKRRYELFYTLLDFSINKPRATHETFLNAITQILLDMYEGNEDKVNELKELARGFRKMIVKNKVNAEIVRWLPSQPSDRHYTRGARMMIQQSRT